MGPSISKFKPNELIQDIEMSDETNRYYNMINPVTSS